MQQLLDLAVRYSQAANIPLTITQEGINLMELFCEARNKGYLNKETFETIMLVLR
ncbi:hypothetical protein V4V35_23615 [Bacillus infantis]|uniref:hypothetical protein n=1 Tax=Bacillus infantis TaxID=324767 RepID=UPI002FBD546C